MNLKTKIIGLLILLCTNVLAIDNNINNSVVKIFTTASYSNYKQPWQTNKLSARTGSGTIINGNLILTSAHVVTNAIEVEVKKENDSRKYLAKVKFISHYADLALLEMEDSNFFKDTKALKLTTNVHTKDRVTIVGYPLGGNNISTTTGVVSRIEQVSYVYSNKTLLAIQIDAAVNSGNSGGPAINDKNELIGIVMMRRLKASNISYIVPTVIINRFFEDIKDGKVDGFPSDYIFYKGTDNKTMKEYYGLEDGKGVITSFLFSIPSNVDIGKNDILLEIDGHDIDNNGDIDTQYGKISLKYILNQKQIGESVKLKIIKDKDKKPTMIDYKLIHSPAMIEYEWEKQPRYIIYGGFIFSPVTYNYLNYITKLERQYVETRLYNTEKTDDYQEAIALLGTTFSHDVNREYGHWGNVLISVNDIKIKSFKHLVEVLDSISSKYTIFEFKTQSKIILNTKEAKESFKDISTKYGLVKDRFVR
jgi:S1-C subfamily serine protease